MKRSLLVLLCAIWWLGARAQNATIIVTQTDLPYLSQTWFYSGYGSDLQTDKISDHWDEGRRITSVAYTANGWFVTMAKNSGYTSQTYYNEYTWPADWIKEKWDEDYYITDATVGNGEWMFVMSKGTEYTNQSYKSAEWSEIKEYISDKWNEDYYITEATCNNGEWFVVMTKGCGMSDQVWVRRSSFSEMKKAIKEYWDDDYTLTLLERGESGIFLAVLSKFEDGSEPGQNYVLNPSDVSDYVQERWDDGQDIVYIGGGGAAND